MGGALVTGAGRRVGRALALVLGQRGYHVLVHYNGSQTGAEETTAMIRAAGGTADILRADLSDAAEVQNLFAAALRVKTPIDLLVNSASLFERDEIADLDPHRFDRQIAVNLKAPAL